jgi:hypothetical protein
MPPATNAVIRGDQVVVVVDAAKHQRLVERFRQRQNFPLAILGGVVVGAVGAFLWGAIIGITGLSYELAWVPMVGIGFLVGTMVRVCGKGIDRRFAVAGAVVALLAALAGSVFTTAVCVTWQLRGVPNFYLFNEADLGTWLRLLVANTGWVEVLLLAFTTWEAYTLSRFRLTPAQLATLAPRGELP